MAYQHHRLGIDAIVLRPEIAPQRGVDSQNAKQIGSGEDTVGLFRESPVSADVY